MASYLEWDGASALTRKREAPIMGMGACQGKERDR